MNETFIKVLDSEREHLVQVELVKRLEGIEFLLDKNHHKK